MTAAAAPAAAGDVDLPASPAVALLLASPRRPPASGSRRRGRTRALLAAVAVLLVVGVPLVGVQLGQAASGEADRLQLFVVVPQDGDLPAGLVAATEHEASLAVSWLEQQAGRALQGDVTRPRTVRLPVTDAALRGSSLAATRTILNLVRGRGPGASAFPVVVTTASTRTPAGSEPPCARGSTQGLVVFLGNCPDWPSESSTWGSPISRRIAHELVHGMGAVADCAPNGTTSGHVLDDPADLMYGGLQEVDPATTPITLDADRDDYFAHDNTGCPDILSSPLWRDGPAPGRG